MNGNINRENLNNMIDSVTSVHIPTTGAVPLTNAGMATNANINSIYTDQKVGITGLKNYKNSSSGISNVIKANSYNGISQVQNQGITKQPNVSNVSNSNFQNSNTVFASSNYSQPAINGVVIPANASTKPVSEISSTAKDKILNSPIQSAQPTINNVPSNTTTVIQNKNDLVNNKVNTSADKIIDFKEVDNNLVNNNPLNKTQIKIPVKSSKIEQPPVYGINPPPKKFFDK